MALSLGGQLLAVLTSLVLNLVVRDFPVATCAPWCCFASRCVVVLQACISRVVFQVPTFVVVILHSRSVQPSMPRRDLLPL